MPLERGAGPERSSLAQTLSWSSFFGAREFRRSASATLFLLLALALSIPHFFQWVDLREGKVLNDVLLNRIPPVDRSVPMFGLLYGMLVISVFTMRSRPLMLLRALMAYAIMVSLRLLTMTIVPLDPPPTLVTLTDPISQLFYPGAEPFTKDLFYSGHVATAVILTLTMAGTWRWAFSLGSVLIAYFLLQQHVHYTVDLIAAPFAALLSWWAAGEFISRLSPFHRSQQPS